jgi:hypothetical protein
MSTPVIVTIRHADGRVTYGVLRPFNQQTGKVEA